MKTCPRCGKETDQPFHTCLKMKTPQEEAEDMARRIAINLFGGQPNSEIGKQIVDRESKEILDVTALPQLIAVARAANGLSMGSDWNHGTHAKEHGYRQQLIDALKAIRATRKVEL